MKRNISIKHLAAIATVLLTPLAVEASLLSGPIVNPANGHKYYLLESDTWSASEGQAVGLGGHLVTINDATENAWVLSTFSLYGGVHRDLWIGLSDFASEGVWVWSSGEALSYANWNPGEPNNSGDQDFVFMLGMGRATAGYWDDYFDVSAAPPFPLHGVVEVVPEPGTCLLASAGLVSLLFFRRKRRGTASVVAMMLLSLCAPSMSRADTYFHWTGGGSDDNFSASENWAEHRAPDGNPYSYERLFFEGVSGTVNNDLVEATFQELFFSDGSYSYFGNAADVAQLTLSVTNSNWAGIWLAADIRGADIFFDYDDFREDQSTTADLHFGVGSEIRLTGEGPKRFSTYGYGAHQNRVALAGTNGRMTAEGPAEAWIGNATLFIELADRPNVPGRIGSDIHVFLDQGAQLKLNSYVGEAFSYTETVSQLTVVGSAILNVEGASGEHDTVLSVQNDVASGGLALYNASYGELGAATGPAPRVILHGQETSSFLGPQRFYLNGNVNWGGSYAKYEFAAYDEERGVVSATTLDNPADLTTATASDVVQIDRANPAALADDPEATTNYKLTGNATVKALAFNGDLLYSKQEGEPGPVATLALEHLLLTHHTAAVAVNLDFGSSAGTITTENWFHNRFPEVDVLADISGTNSLTIRGYGELNYRAAASFSGELIVEGGYLNLADAGSFANVDTVRLGAEGGIISSLELYGVDNTGPTPVTVDRLKDDARVIAAGNSEMSLESDSAGTTPTTEKVGEIVVTGTRSNFSLMVQAGDLDTHSAASAAGWEVGSISFDGSASGSGVYLSAFGAGNTITINGGPIMLENGNYLAVSQGNGGRVITQGIGIAEGSSASFLLQGQIDGDIDLQGGGFSFSQTESSIVGNLTLGTGLNTSLALPTLSDDAPFGMFAASEARPMLFIDGDLTLGGTFHVAQTGAFETGSWLVFQYSGAFTALDFTVYGMDGDYTLTVDEMTRGVYVNAVPEPSTYAMLIIGGCVLAFGFLRRRKRILPNTR